MEANLDRLPDKSIAFIGSVGLPNCYGGFESFLESVAPVIAGNKIRVIVTCDKGRYKDHPENYKGVKLEYVPIRANGALSQLHDFVAFCKVFSTVDAIIVLGVSAGFFFPIMRLIGAIFRKELLVNVDGIEWRRNKFSRSVRCLLKLYDFLAQLFANKIIYDNRELLPYIYPKLRTKAYYIPYSGDHVARMPYLAREQFALTICRVEPENNLEMLIQGVLESNLDRYTIIGNWSHSSYGSSLRARFAGEKRLTLLDPIYDALKVASYREMCVIYLHGHSVGGTNPSLVEMLFYDCHILCFDCDFNRSTADRNADYFLSPRELANKINEKIKINLPVKRVMTSQYTAQNIARSYIHAVFGEGKEQSCLPAEAFD